METITKRFNNLGGQTVSEHKKAFNLYKTNLDNLNPPEIDAVLNGITSNDNQQHIFRVKLLIKYQKNDALMHVLYSGNKILSKFILKDIPFIKNLYQQFGAENFVGEVCPKISYVNRTNAISMLANCIEDPIIGDEYYRAVLDKYGFKAANVLLVVCSEDLVRQTALENKLKLTDRQLLKLHKKYPTFLDYYFKTCDNNFGEYPILAQNLVLTEMETFSRLLQFGEPHIGKLAFRHYLNAQKQNIIDCKYYRNKHNKLKMNYLTETEYALFFKNSFPKQMGDFSLNDAIKKIKMLPIATRGHLLFTTYQQLYEVPFEEYSNTLLTILSIQDRMKFKIKKEDVEFYSIEKSIPIIKEQISVTADISSRKKLFTKLIQTCKINNDKEALGEVLQYFNKKHGNDNVELRQNFLIELKNEFKINDLNNECWKHIYDLLPAFEGRKGSNYYYNSNNSSYYLQKSIERKFNLDEDYKSDMLKYVQKSAHYGVWTLTELKPNYQKKFILNLPEILPQLVDKEQSYENVCAKFISTLVSWNNDHRKDKISYYDYPEILKVIFNDLSNKSINCWMFYIADMVCFLPDSNESKLLHHELLEKYINYGDLGAHRNFAWILKHKPEFIMKYPKKFMKMKDYVIPMERHYFYEISKLHFTGLPNSLYSTARQIVEVNDSNDEIPAALAYLSYTSDFVSIITKLHPKPDFKISLYDVDMSNLLGIHTTILNCFKHAAIPFEGIDVVLKYCTKDYLHHALTTLYYIMYHSPEEKIQGPLNELLTRAVSVRKHTIYLASMLCDTKLIMKVLKEMGATEKNSSLKKFIFKRSFLYFCNNPSEAALNLVVSHLILLSRKDTESFDMLMDFSKIPHKYFGGYLHHIYNYVKGFGENEEFQIISNINKDVIQLLPSEFCDEIIKDCFTKKKYDSGVADLIFNYLLYSGDLVQHRFQVFSTCIDFGESVYEIFKSISQRIIQEQNVVFSEDFLKCFESLKLLSDNLECEILLEATVFYARTRNLEKLARYFVETKSKSLLDKFGPEIETFYKLSILRFVDVILEGTEGSLIENRLKFAAIFCKVSDNCLGKLLAIEVMPKEITKNPYFVKLLNATIEGIIVNSTPIVKIYLDAYLKNVKIIYFGDIDC